MTSTACSQVKYWKAINSNGKRRLSARVSDLKIVFPLLLLATLGMLAALPHIVSADDQDQNEGRQIQFEIRLTGDQQAPPVNTAAFGFAEVQLSSDNSTLEFQVVVCNIANVVASHIHVNATGPTGPVVLPFFSSPAPGFSSPDGCNTLAEGTRTSTNLIARPDIGINNWNDFINALIAGNTYINVHTTANPGGEIRGQLVAPNENEQGND